MFKYIAIFILLSLGASYAGEAPYYKYKIVGATQPAAPKKEEPKAKPYIPKPIGEGWQWDERTGTWWRYLPIVTPPPPQFFKPQIKTYYKT
jgi:hypothetical protein